jgi:hypothetical protein
MLNVFIIILIILNYLQHLTNKEEKNKYFIKQLNRQSFFYL